MPFGNIDAIPHLFPLPSGKGEDVGQVVSKPNLPRPARRGEGWGEGENNRKALRLTRILHERFSLMPVKGEIPGSAS